MLTKAMGLTVLVVARLLLGPTGHGGLDGKKPGGRPTQAPSVTKGLPSTEEFGRAVVNLRTAPEEAASREAMEQALKILDHEAIAILNGSGQDLLLLANQRLTGYVTRMPAAGEGYRLYQITRGPDVYALAANFGSSGPSAVRVYARSGPQELFGLAGRIDRFSQNDYFDDYLELIGVDSPDAVFVTVTGRTDELRSGSFASWRFDGKGVVELWTSDLLPHSSYEAVPGGIVITYCADSDEAIQAACRKRQRERHWWDGTAWKSVQKEEIPANGR